MLDGGSDKFSPQVSICYSLRTCLDTESVHHSSEFQVNYLRFFAMSCVIVVSFQWWHYCQRQLISKARTYFVVWHCIYISTSSVIHNLLLSGIWLQSMLPVENLQINQMFSPMESCSLS